MARHRLYFVVVRTQIVLDVFLGLVFLVPPPLEEAEYGIGAVVISHLAASVLMYRDGKRFRDSGPEDWSRAMTVPREILSAYPVFVLMLFLKDVPEVHDVFSTVLPTLSGLFVFGIWLQMVGPRLTDHTDPTDILGILASRERQRANESLSRREKRQDFRLFLLPRRMFTSAAYGLSFFLDICLIAYWATWFTNGAYVILPVCISHMVGLLVVHSWSRRAVTASPTRWMRVNQVGRQLLVAQGFLVVALHLQSTGVRGMAVEVTVAVLQLLMVGIWIAIIGPGRTAYVEARTENRSLSRPALAAVPLSDV